MRTKYYIKVTQTLRDFEKSRYKVWCYPIGTHYSNLHSAYNTWNRAIKHGGFNMGIDVNVYGGFITIYKK